MPGQQPLFRAISSSARQLQLLLKCISFVDKAQVRITQEGMRFSTEEGSTMEAWVYLEKSLFSSYNYRTIIPSSEEEPADPPIFQVNLASLLETLNIFSLSDPAAIKKPESYDAFAAHRLNRHAGINAFSNHNIGVTGICTFGYQGDGSPLSVHMSEAGVTTTCELSTYEPQSVEEIPFNRDSLALKTIMRSSTLLDAIQELSSMNPQHMTLTASPTTRRDPELSISASGALGSVTIDFTTSTDSETPVLETFQCSTRTTASFKFAMIKSAQRAMAAASKVSVRLDDEGVLSLQFLVEVEGGSGGEGIAFVDFRIVPLVEGEAEEHDADDSNNDED